MIPKAKKTIHECKFHYANMIKSRHVEDFEISLSAFVQSTRNVTFSLQKQYKGSEPFDSWYKSKQEEMSADELCLFFVDLRNKIVKEGENDLHCSTIITSGQFPRDYGPPPANSQAVLTGKGAYWHINEGTEKEDMIPAYLTGTKAVTNIRIDNPPSTHLGKAVDNNLIILCKIHLDYLIGLVDEFTGLPNK